MTKMSDDQVPLMVSGLRSRLRDLKDEIGSAMGQMGYFEDEHFELMALCFVSKQIDHAESILKVFPSNDMVLMARSMVEGLGWLYWAANDPQDRAAKWRDFSVIESFRSLEFRDLVGDPPTQEMLEQLDEGLRERGDQFLTRKQRNEIEKGSATKSDPYQKNWAGGKSVRALFEDLDSESLYTGFYAPFSQWTHWCPTAFASVLNKLDDKVQYGSSMDARDQASVLSTAFRCLLESTLLLADHMRIPLAKRLDEIGREYVAWQNGVMGLDGQS